MKGSVCRSKACGVLGVLEHELDHTVIPALENTHRFVGVDVSTKFTGVCSLRMSRQANPAAATAAAGGVHVKLVHSRLLEMPSASPSSSNKNELFHARFNALSNTFQEIKEPGAEIRYRVTVEDKVLVPGKGSIGSHFLAEVIAAARIAAAQTFRCTPNTISPLSARSGLGLNDTSAGANRKQTKLAIVQWTRKQCPELFQSMKKEGLEGEDDLADAYVLALSALRSALAKELCQNTNVMEHFSRCHPGIGKTELDAQLATRVPKWLAASKRFAKV